jgi:exosome complex exonuclease RRP6
MTSEQIQERDIGRGVLSAHVPKITDLLDRLTADAANLPGRSDLQFHRTIDRAFAKELDGAGERLLELTDRLVGLAQADEARAREIHKREIASAAVQRGPSVTNGVIKSEQAKGKGKGKGKARVIKDEEDVTENFKRTVGDALDAILESAVSYSNCVLSTSNGCYCSGLIAKPTG